MNFLETNLLRIGYEAGGPADGPGVLLLHGWPDDATGLCTLAPFLEKSRISVGSAVSTRLRANRAVAVEPSTLQRV